MRIGGAQRLRALHDRDGLELLLPHDGTDAVLRGDVAVVALNRRQAYEVLARRPDRVDGELVSDQSQVAAERVLRFPRVLADVGLGVTDLDTVVVDIEIDQSFACPWITIAS